MTDLTGAIDLHVHSAPDVYPRSLDDLGVARAAEAAGMRAILLKSHHTLTADRAALVDSQVDIAVRGGLALNLTVGGLNPVAVEAAIELGARQIWMPTIHSRQSLRAATAEMFVNEAKKGRAGLVAFDEDGTPVPGLRDILEMVRDAGIVLGTGHLAPEESLALLELAHETGVERLLVTHPMMSFTRFSLGQMQRAVELGAYLEFDALACLPQWPESVPPAVTAGAIMEIGAENCVLASDGGQVANPQAPQMLLTFAEQLAGEGISPAALRTMMRENPEFLLGL